MASPRQILNTGSTGEGPRGIWKVQPHSLVKTDAKRWCRKLCAQLLIDSFDDSLPPIIDIDECASNPCLNVGTCDDRVDGYICACASGWEGDICEISRNNNFVLLPNECYRAKSNVVCHLEFQTLQGNVYFHTWIDTKWVLSLHNGFIEALKMC